MFNRLRPGGLSQLSDHLTLSEQGIGIILFGKSFIFLSLSTI
jgi:hypothetical protein